LGGNAKIVKPLAKIRPSLCMPYLSDLVLVDHAVGVSLGAGSEAGILAICGVLCG
jgi:hypothetical protein